MALTRSGATRANFGDLLEPGLREIFFQQYSELPTLYDKIFHVFNSTKQDETDTSVSGFGQLVETTEGAPITYEDPKLNGAYNREVIRKFLKLRETLKRIFKTIRRQIREIKKFLRASETIIGTSFGMVG